MSCYFFIAFITLKLLRMKQLTLILVAILSLNSMNAQQQPVCNPYPKTISVTGTAELEIVPDEIYVQVDLREYKKKGDEKVDIEVIKTEFLSACKSIGLPDSVITIASYEGMNNADWWRKKKKDPNLFATISYQIKFSSSKKMDDLVSKLNDEATSNFKIVRTWHSKMTEYRKQLKIAAVKAAKEKGIYLTEAIGEKLGSAVTITEDNQPLNVMENENLTYQFSTSNTFLYRNQDKLNQDDTPALNFKIIKLRFNATIIYALQ